RRRGLTHGALISDLRFPVSSEASGRPMSTSLPYRRDVVNLARHFSAGSRAKHEPSSGGTTETRPIFSRQTISSNRPSTNPQSKIQNPKSPAAALRVSGVLARTGGQDDSFI